MYKVLKDKGHTMNVSLENTETKASVLIGKLDMEILKILESDDRTFGTADGDIKLDSEWDFEVDDETARILSTKAMRMRKPVRDQSKKSEQKHEEVTPKKKQPVDVFDLIFGIDD